MPVVRQADISWDLQVSPLTVQTDSTDDSGDILRLSLKDANGDTTGCWIFITFAELTYLEIQSCTDEFPLSPIPTGPVKKWTFSKTSTDLVISCNGVTLLTYVFSSSSETNCVERWKQEIYFINFSSEDTASDLYGLELAGSNLTMYSVSTD